MSEYSSYLMHVSNQAVGLSMIPLWRREKVYNVLTNSISRQSTMLKFLLTGGYCNDKGVINES